jgi:pimeloyl-ACP methyl ester carboxylesterase
MRRRRLFVPAAAAAAAVVGAMIGSTIPAAAAATICTPVNTVLTCTGTQDGADFKIEVPANWNGTLALYSHGYTAKLPGVANPARDVGDPVTGATLLSQGFALAGSAYSDRGWALQQAFHDQIDLLDHFSAITGRPAPKRTVAWGHSLGGIITAGLVQLNPTRFAGALPMCGVLAGGVSAWNKVLDSVFVFQKLVAGGDPRVQLANITDPAGSFAAAREDLQKAQQTPEGRARIALSAAVADVVGWFDPFSPEPAADDFAAQEQNQFLWSQNVDFFFAWIGRAELEARAGGNPASNTGVNYARQLARSIDNREVRTLYRAAGLSLENDLETLADAPRIAANPTAFDYLKRFITFNGDIRIPVLTLHTSGDGLVQPSNEQPYAAEIREEGNGRFLRQAFVHRAGHCTFTPAETVAAFQTLLHRVGAGRWADTSPEDMNELAASLGSLNVLSRGGTAVPTRSEFFHFVAPVDLRPFTV